MALFLRGNVWWMEYRTRSVRKVKSTGFKREDRAKARAAYDAMCLAMRTRMNRKAMESILEAIYGDEPDRAKIPLDGVWAVYEDWMKGKGRKVSHDTFVNRRNLFALFVKWCGERGCHDLKEVSVNVAREFVKWCASSGKSNKTQRTYCGYISSIWEAVGQMHEGVHNPWKAACPDDDGSSVRRAAFSDEQTEKILAAAKRIGHDWYLASMIALYTGLRYGDVARLDWKDIDLAKNIITVTPNKTKHSSGVEVSIPMARPLRAAIDAAAKVCSRGFVLPEHGIKYTAGKNQQPLDVPFSDVLKAVGLTGAEYTFHSWRHTANSRMAEAGVPSAVRQMICGWTNDAMARHYDHATHLKELTEAVGKI